MTETLTITQPDDWHLHVRDGEMLERVVPFTAAQFGRALIMPNLNPPVQTVEQALDYRKRIFKAVPHGNNFDPKMSLYLTDDTPVAEVSKVANCEHILGFKLYPAGATTNSSSGVTKISGMMNLFESMAKHDVVLQVHGEVTDSHVDIFDREAVFIDQVLFPLHRELPELSIVLEHITTSQGVDFVKDTNHFVGATITPQHLMFDRNEIFRGGIRPHLYCLPILKRQQHRLALLEAVASGDPSFFLGTDSAPHTLSAKENDCGCAGIFSAPNAIEFYAEIFENLDCLDKLESFASTNGANFYHLDKNPGQITLIKKAQKIPNEFSDIEHIRNNDLVPLLAGESVPWSIKKSGQDEA